VLFIAGDVHMQYVVLLKLVRDYPLSRTGRQHSLRTILNARNKWRKKQEGRKLLKWDRNEGKEGRRPRKGSCQLCQTTCHDILESMNLIHKLSTYDPSVREYCPKCY
jgi:hypothetical protein